MFFSLRYFGQHLIAVPSFRQAIVQFNQLWVKSNQLSVKLTIIRIRIGTKSNFRCNTKTNTFNIDTGTWDSGARRSSRCRMSNFSNSWDVGGGKDIVSPSPDHSSWPALQLWRQLLQNKSPAQTGCHKNVLDFKGNVSDLKKDKTCHTWGRDWSMEGEHPTRARQKRERRPAAKVPAPAFPAFPFPNLLSSATRGTSQKPQRWARLSRWREFRRCSSHCPRSTSAIGQRSSSSCFLTFTWPITYVWCNINVPEV